jgi:choline dehydrogenase-like flavoprotein
MAEERVDVLIIGSGHSGGMAAKILTGKGISCLMLNAGPVVDFQKDRELKAAYQLQYHGFMTPGQLPHVYQATEFNANTWLDEKEVPYTYDSQNPYNWVRVRLFGGRSLFWVRMSFHLSDYEFKAKEGKTIEIKPDNIHLRDLRVLGAGNVWGFTGSALRCATDGMVRTDQMITHHYQLEDHKLAFSRDTVNKPSYVKGIFQL